MDFRIHKFRKDIPKDSRIDIAPFEKIIRRAIMRMEHSRAVHKTQLVSLPKQADREVQIFTVTGAEAVLVENISSSQSCNVGQLRSRKQVQVRRMGFVRLPHIVAIESRLAIPLRDEVLIEEI